MCQNGFQRETADNSGAYLRIVIIPIHVFSIITKMVTLNVSVIEVLVSLGIS